MTNTPADTVQTQPDLTDRLRRARAALEEDAALIEALRQRLLVLKNEIRLRDEDIAVLRTSLVRVAQELVASQEI